MAHLTSPIAFALVHHTDRPLQDEWGIFDPRQAGLEALLRKLQSGSGDTDGTRKPPVPVVK